MKIASRLARAWLCVWLAGAATAPLASEMSGMSGMPAIAPFSSDGCSRFPDRAPVGDADWCHCCLAHDLAYWRGGTENERLQADERLRECVGQATNNPVLAHAMYAGVRAGGGPLLHTPYRWGYGWPYGRNYGPLSVAENVSADVRQAKYLARHPALTCRK